MDELLDFWERYCHDHDIPRAYVCAVDTPDSAQIFMEKAIMAAEDGRGYKKDFFDDDEFLRSELEWLWDDDVYEYPGRVMPAELKPHGEIYEVYICQERIGWLSRNDSATVSAILSSYDQTAIEVILAGGAYVTLNDDTVERCFEPYRATLQVTYPR